MTGAASVWVYVHVCEYSICVPLIGGNLSSFYEHLHKKERKKSRNQMIFTGWQKKLMNNDYFSSATKYTYMTRAVYIIRA